MGCWHSFDRCKPWDHRWSPYSHHDQLLSVPNQLDHRRPRQQAKERRKTEKYLMKPNFTPSRRHRIKIISHLHFWVLSLPVRVCLLMLLCWERTALLTSPQSSCEKVKLFVKTWSIFANLTFYLHKESHTLVIQSYIHTVHTVIFSERVWSFNCLSFCRVPPSARKNSKFQQSRAGSKPAWQRRWNVMHFRRKFSDSILSATRLKTRLFATTYWE